MGLESLKSYLEKQLFGIVFLALVATIPSMVPTNDHDTRPPEVRAHRAYHFLHWLDRHGRWLLDYSRLWFDQPGHNLI